MKRVALFALACAVSSCMPVHDVTLGKDEPRIFAPDAGGDDDPQPDEASPGPADAASQAQESLDASDSLEPPTDASSLDAAHGDAARGDAAHVDAARVDAAGAYDAGDDGGDAGRVDGGDGGTSHDGDDTTPHVL